MGRNRGRVRSQKGHQPNDQSAQTQSNRRSHKGQRLNVWKESDMKGALDEWQAGTQKSIRHLARSWNVSPATLFKRTKKDVIKSEHLSGRNTVLSEQQEAELLDLNPTIIPNSNSRPVKHEQAVSDIKLAGCTFYDLCKVPRRERKIRKRRLQSPSYHLTSDDHLDFVRNALAK